jgi:hypothetical protein
MGEANHEDHGIILIKGAFSAKLLESDGGSRARRTAARDWVLRGTVIILVVCRLGLAAAGRSNIRRVTGFCT